MLICRYGCTRVWYGLTDKATRRIDCLGFTVYSPFLEGHLRGEVGLLLNSVTSIDAWRTDYIYVLSVLGRAPEGHFIHWVEQGVWYGVTVISIWRTDNIYVLSNLGRTLHPVGGAGSLVRSDSHRHLDN